MRKSKAIIYILTVLFLCLMLFLTGKETQWDGGPAITVRIPGKTGTETVTLWEPSYGNYCLFLPGYAPLSQIRLSVEVPDLTVAIGDVELKTAVACDRFALNTPHTLTYTYRGQTYTRTLTIFQSGNVPTLYVDVSSGSMDYIHADKTHKEPGTARLYGPDGTLLHSGNLEQLDGRGQSTWALPKKSYNLTLSSEADLLGMGNARNWVLLSNYNDPTNLKNKLVYDFADKAGLAYSPDSTLVDLYLNGEYAGLYLLCERTEVHPQRVDLTEPGSFLVCQDHLSRMEQQGKPHISLQSGVALRIYRSDVSDEDLQQIWQSAENAILAEDGIDPVSGKHWQEIIDMDSWARKYLIEEVFGNSDAPVLSQFFYRSGTGKICAGPVWDYDLSMAAQTPVNRMFANRPYLPTAPWIRALYENQDFRRHVVILYQTEFLPLLEPLLRGGVMDAAVRTEPAARMNQLRWGCPDPIEQAGAVQVYLARRAAFLQDLWIEEEVFFCVTLRGQDGQVISYMLRPGDLVPELPEQTDTQTHRFCGWFYADTDEPFDSTRPIAGDTVICAKFEELPA